jgi:hypothetical protein
MMNKFNISVFITFLLVVFFSYKQIVSIPDHLVQEAHSLQTAYDQAVIRNANDQKAFLRTQSSTEWGFLKPYAEKENWADKLSLSKKSLKEASLILKDGVWVILENDHRDDNEALKLAVKTGFGLLDKTHRNGHYPFKRESLILKGRDNKDLYYATSKDNLNSSISLSNIFSIIANKSINTHQHKMKDINIKLADGQVLLAEIYESQSIISKEYDSTVTDYSIYSDTYDISLSQTQVLADYYELMAKHLAQLDRSYVKVLSDQMVDYYITIGRASWCDGEYCGSGDENNYPPSKVDADTYEYFDSLTVDKIASYSYRRFNLNIDPARWNALNIHEKKSWNSSHDDAEYWVKKMEMKASHKYTTIENGATKEQDWEVVSNDIFWANEPNLGMAIISKPLGFYESETIKSAEPVGMAMVAKPIMRNGAATGSNQYGEWRQSEGKSFFYYYGMYSMASNFLPSNRYSYNQWNGYNTRDRNSTYYGTSNNYGTFGRDTYKNSRFQKSAYSRRNPNVVRDSHSGVRRKGSNSIRGAGASGRGKGPSGGGK